MNARYLRTLAAVALAGLLAGAPGNARAITLTGPLGMIWDIQDTSTGAIQYGSNYSFYNCFLLSVNGTQYNAGGTLSTSFDGGRGVQMGEQTSGDLTVQRTVWVPGAGTYDYARWVDMVTNNGTSTTTVTWTYTGVVGDYWDMYVTSTSSGDTLIDPSVDTWFAAADSYGFSGPSGQVWWDDTMLGPDTMTMGTWGELNVTFSSDVPPGGSAAIMFFVVQHSNSTTIHTTCDWLAGLPEESVLTLSGDEMLGIVNWPVGGAPVIRVVTDPLEVNEGEVNTIEVNVEDMEGDTFVVEWDTDMDGAWDDGTGETADFNAEGLDGPTTSMVSVKATDSASNERILDLPLDVINVPPVFISDPTVDPGLELHRGITWEYQIEVEDPANAFGPTLDPVQVQVTEKPDGMIFYGDLRLVWTPPMSPGSIGEHSVVISADDFDGDPSLQELTLNVLANAPPDPPTILSPSETTVSVTRPTLVIENSTDIDGDSLSYTFQVDTTGEFLPATLVTAGNLIENSSGQTSWTVNATLEDGNRYYWRVWANDGSQDGDPSETWFDVDLSATEPDPDADPDAETDAEDDGPLFEPDNSDCGCTFVH